MWGPKLRKPSGGITAVSDHSYRSSARHSARTGTSRVAREPIDDRAQHFECLGGVACFGVELGEVTGGVQFEEARFLIA